MTSPLHRVNSVLQCGTNISKYENITIVDGFPGHIHIIYYRKYIGMHNVFPVVTLWPGGCYVMAAT